jgi:hypothetical protein
LNKASRYLLGFLAFGFVVAGGVVFLQNFTGARVDSYLFPCALIGSGLLAAGLAWNFGSGVDAEGLCASDDDEDKHSPVDAGSDDAA